MAGYIGSRASVVSSGAERKKTFDITGTTTVLTGLSYTPTFVHLFHNGVRLVDGTDYTATNSTSITLTTAAENGDQVVVVSYATFQPSDTVSASAGGTFAGDVSVTGAFTSLGIDDNAAATAVTIDASGNVGIGTSSPSSQVDILGASSRLRLDGSSASFQILSRNTSDSTTNALTFDADTYTFNRAGSTEVVIDSSGNVGIGTASPSNLLSLYTAGAATKPLVVYAGSNEAGTKTSLKLGAYVTGVAGSEIRAETHHFGTLASTLEFLTGDTERMRIDSAGRVTTPYQPAFYAGGNSGWITTTSGGIVPLGAVGVNVGNGYNISSYAYTAPVSGLYYVSLHAYLNTAAQIVLKKNGSDYVSQGADTSFLIYTNGTSTGSTSGVIYLNAGDYIQMGARTNQSAYVYTGHSHFSGYLIG